ncbi:MAG TPA: helix-turn-helix domain-containing protein [Flavisolibacter sp.]|jgi:putative transcriptional regulator|nr:helix-turn-helix domain-containing protein [Flavisolibacter sp.]
MKNSIKEERIKNSLTQITLAEKAAVSRQTIISIETGKYIPSTLLALKLAKILGKKVDDLFSLEKDD